MQSESELWTIESISNESNQSSQSSVTKAVLDKLGAPSYLVNPGVCRLHKDQACDFFVTPRLLCLSYINVCLKVANNVYNFLKLLKKLWILFANAPPQPTARKFFSRHILQTIITVTVFPLDNRMYCVASIFSTEYLGRQ